MSVGFLIYNGVIQCVDDGRTTANWLYAEDGIIRDLGTGDGYLKYFDERTETRDLGGKTVLPGFIDSHINLVFSSIIDAALDLSSARDLEDTLQMIQARLDGAKSKKPLICVNYDPEKISEKRFPTRYELDKCSISVPIMINSGPWNDCAVNSPMLFGLHIPFGLPGIEKDARGLPTGYIYGQSNFFARTALSRNTKDTDCLKSIDSLLNAALSMGITTMVDFEGGYISHDNFAKLIFRNQDRFPVDIVLFYQSLKPSVIRDPRYPRIGGLFLDGNFTSRTAAISSAYTDTGTMGSLFYTDDELLNFVVAACREKKQVTAHCVGDRACEQLIKAYEKAQEFFPEEDIRFRIEHCELISFDNAARAAELGIILSMQPSFEGLWGEKGQLYDRILGDLSTQTNRSRSLIDQGNRLVYGSDYAVGMLSPLAGIRYAVSPPKRQHAVSVDEAVRAYTINGAYGIKEESRKGSLERGKLCDLVVLSEDIYTVAPETIGDIKVSMTVKEGKVLYEI